MQPPRTQITNARPTEPECSRTPFGEIKIPEPMMLPVHKREIKKTKASVFDLKCND